MALVSNNIHTATDKTGFHNRSKKYQHRGSKSLERQKDCNVNKTHDSFTESDIELQKSLHLNRCIRKLEKDRDIRRFYEIDHLIGQGNFSDVFLVIRKLDSSKLAMKKIHKKNLNEAHYLVKNEVEILRKLLHKNICRFLEAFETNTSYFLFFEYLPNGDLFEALTTIGTPSERITSKVVAQVASALDYLHSGKIVHRDVKPENLLLTSDFVVKLTDFGLACFAQEPLYRVCGTPTYIAPEVLKQTGYGVAVDIWSLGIILHLMLVGHSPFNCSSRHRLFRMILNADFTFAEPKWSNVSKGAVSLLSKMLVIDASRRYTASQVCSHQWVSAENRS